MRNLANIFHNKSDKRSNVDSCMRIAEDGSGRGAVMRDYVFHQLSTLSASRAENKGNISERKIFKFDFFETQSYFYSWLRGYYAWNLHRLCHWSMSSSRAKDLVKSCSLLSAQVAGKRNLILLSLTCKFSNEITLSKDGVYCHLLFDVQQADYVYVKSRQRQLST